MIVVDNRQDIFKPLGELPLKNGTTANDIEDWLKGHGAEILNLLDLSKYELSISLVGLEEIKKLHNKFMGEPSATDVLAFPQDFNDDTFEAEAYSSSDFLSENGKEPTKILGDVVICPEYIFTTLKNKDTSKDDDKNNTEESFLQKEVLKLLVHGILHLTGHNHYKRTDKKKMFKLQDEILKQLV